MKPPYKQKINSIRENTPPLKGVRKIAPILKHSHTALHQCNVSVHSTSGLT